jgi:hypothetical protein
MSERTDIPPDTQETNISETILDDTDRARIVAGEAARQAERDANTDTRDAKIAARPRFADQNTS